MGLAIDLKIFSFLKLFFLLLKAMVIEGDSKFLEMNGKINLILIL